MSITAETAKAHAKDPAVLCCRAEEGIIIAASNLEDPDIFDDLVDSGLLKLDGALTIAEVIGARLLKTCDALTPLKRDLVEEVKAAEPVSEAAKQAGMKQEIRSEGKLARSSEAGREEHSEERPEQKPEGNAGERSEKRLEGKAEERPDKMPEERSGEKTDKKPEKGAAENARIAETRSKETHKMPAGGPIFGAKPVTGSVLKIDIGEGKNIHIELPLGIAADRLVPLAEPGSETFSASAAAGQMPTGQITAGAVSASETATGETAAGEVTVRAVSAREEAIGETPLWQAVKERQAALSETAADGDRTAHAVKPAETAEKCIRRLKRKHYKITEVRRGPETKIEGTILYIRDGIEQNAADAQELVHELKLDVITPEQYHTYSDTILDVQPIAVKEGDDALGSGTTRVLDGIVVLLTGTDENGVQIGEFGSSEGYLDENIMWGRPGAPDKGELLLRTSVRIAAGTNMERPGPMAAHATTDIIIEEIRQALKKLEDDELLVSEEHFAQMRRPGKKKVVIVKEIMGQGAMHDNLILPLQPVGVLGAKPNVDLGNVPVMTSPLEVLDGCIHALTCIGPASKETSRHYWREPLVLEVLNDEELDLCGVLFVGSPQINAEKFYVSKRVGMTVEALDVDGAFVTTEGFGNNHIDFASHIEQIGMRGVPVVGMSFCAVQGALVVGNPYMKYMVDLNKSESGIENEVLGCNTLCPEDAVRAAAMLKNVMAGEEIEAAPKEVESGGQGGKHRIDQRSTRRKDRDRVKRAVAAHEPKAQRKV